MCWGQLWDHSSIHPHPTPLVNLVLADVDGRIVWQTKTANKGGTGTKKKRRFIWQSFQHPTNTIVRGQSLKNSHNGSFSAKRGGWEATGLLNVTFDSMHQEPQTPKPVGSNSRQVALTKIDHRYEHSFLRLESDGDLAGYTFYEMDSYALWAKDYAYFGEVHNGGSSPYIPPTYKGPSVNIPPPLEEPSSGYIPATPS
ncbi:hypothetical protein MKX01_010671 [Papaver californicum]|nr:hypothetical protein MKX01_010671 [Papaver californicum]